MNNNPHGCHSTKAPERLKSEIVYHSSGKTSWSMRFTTDCQYSKAVQDDERCEECSQKFKT